MLNSHCPETRNSLLVKDEIVSLHGAGPKEDVYFKEQRTVAVSVLANGETPTPDDSFGWDGKRISNRAIRCAEIIVAGECPFYVASGPDQPGLHLGTLLARQPNPDALGPPQQPN